MQQLHSVDWQKTPKSTWDSEKQQTRCGKIGIENLSTKKNIATLLFTNKDERIVRDQFLSIDILQPCEVESQIRKENHSASFEGSGQKD